MTSNSQITGREPRLASGYRKPGQRRLSLRNLATMMNVLPPEAVSLDAVTEMLHNEDFFVRYNAAKMLGRRGDRDARMIIQETLQTGDGPSRASVARHLYGFSWFAAEPLIRLALRDEDARVREAAVYALCDLRELNAYQLMVEALATETDDVRAAAAWGLRDCQDPAAVPVLQTALKADDPDVRVKALEALGTNDTPSAIPVVRNAMTDPDPDVKYAATLSLLELAGENWLQELSGIIGRTSGVTLQQILRGFFHATNYLKIDVASSKSADMLIDALETALLDDLPEARLAVIWPLAWMRHPRTPIVLRQAYYRETDSNVKAQFVRVITSLMAENTGAGDSVQIAEAILQDALQSKDEKVRYIADEVVRNRENATVKTEG